MTNKNNERQVVGKAIVGLEALRIIPVSILSQQEGSMKNLTSGLLV